MDIMKPHYGLFDSFSMMEYIIPLMFFCGLTQPQFGAVTSEMNLNCLPSELKGAWKACLPACLLRSHPEVRTGIVSWGRYLDQRPTVFLSPCMTRIWAHAPPCRVLGLTTAVLFPMGKCYISVPVQGWGLGVSGHSLKNWERRAHEAAHFSVSAGICWPRDHSERIMCTRNNRRSWWGPKRVGQRLLSPLDHLSCI